MYVKLIASGYVNPIAMLRDIGRLLTSPEPTTALLSGFSQTSSAVIDSTPAGWTYVGSNMASDQPTIAGVEAATTWAGGTSNLCFSAPCISSPALKYAVLSTMCSSAGANGTSATTTNALSLTGATSASALGVVTSEGPRFVNTANPAGTGPYGYISNFGFPGKAGSTIHLIANQRHITIIHENTGMGAVWEASQTDAHTFYSTAPFVQYTHFGSPVTNPSLTANGPTTVSTLTTVIGGGIMTAAFNVTDVNTGTVYGNYDVGEATVVNKQSLLQTSGNTRANSITTTGALAYQISPVFYSIGSKGYPTQYVSGIVPIYWTAPDIGTSGDIVEVAGDSYTFFDANVNYGVILKTN